MDTKKKSEENHVPVVIGNYAPFRLVLRATDSWQPTLEQINNRTYDYVKLSRLPTFIDIGIAPFSLAIAFDGSLVLPATEQLRDRESVVKKLNETLGILLLGGVYCEAVHPTDISYGSLFLEGYVKVHGGSTGGIAHFHKAIKSKTVGIIEAIDLLDPKTILNTEIEEAYKKGKEYFTKIGNLSPELLLNGTSNYVKHQWIEGLIFLWTAIEQLVNIIWTNRIISDNTSEESIEGRNAFLKDFRTWTTSARIEVLYQKSFISAEMYRLLNVARKARNDFVHNTKEISEETVRRALDALFRIMSLIISDFTDENELKSAYEKILKNQRGELYSKKTKFSKDEVKYWMEIPALPGDTHWDEQQKYEIIEELVLQHIKS